MIFIRDGARVAVLIPRWYWWPGAGKDWPKKAVKYLNLALFCWEPDTNLTLKEMVGEAVSSTRMGIKGMSGSVCS